MVNNKPDSDIYPTVTYIDPLIMPEWIKTNNWHSIRGQIHGDWLLSAFIKKLNQEIVEEIEEFKDYREQIQDIFDATRTYGWCVFQSYAEFDKVFTPLHKEAWIEETDEELNRKKIVGIKINWQDELDNTYTDSLYFDDRPNENGGIVGKAYLIKWKNGDGKVVPHCHMDTKLATPDLDLATLSLAIQIRQIQNTLTFSATNPFFYHLIYGDSITTSQRQSLITQIGYVNTSKGIGAKKMTLEEIVAVENGSIEKCVVALDQLISFFAANTRLPLSYYFGEKQIGSGLDSGGAEQKDMLQIIDKKETILQHLAKNLEEISTEVWGIQLPDLWGYYNKKRQEINEKSEQIEEEEEIIEKSDEDEERT